MKVKFFASLREALNQDILEIDVDAPMTVDELKSRLIEQNPDWREHLTSTELMVAVNQHLVDSDALIQPRDEVAFLPPVTGG